jgi:hypothetical protein
MSANAEGRKKFAEDAVFDSKSPAPIQFFGLEAVSGGTAKMTLVKRVAGRKNPQLVDGIGIRQLDQDFLGSAINHSA